MSECEGTENWKRSDQGQKKRCLLSAIFVFVFLFSNGWRIEHQFISFVVCLITIWNIESMIYDLWEQVSGGKKILMEQWWLWLDYQLLGWLPTRVAQIIKSMFMTLTPKDCPQLTPVSTFTLWILVTLVYVRWRYKNLQESESRVCSQTMSTEHFFSVWNSYTWFLDMAIEVGS